MNDAVARYRKMLEENPRNELARFSLGKALYDGGDFQAAREEFAVALENKPDWMVAQILIGKCELALGRRDAARRAFTRGRQLAVDQDHDGPREEMEQLLTELGSD